MTAIATLPVLLGVGIHASRPAATAVGSGGLYSCTTHSLVYQTDGATWSTWATLGGTPVDDATISITDITTNNSATGQHGWLKKLDGNAAHYMDGSGAWSTPAGSAAIPGWVSAFVGTTDSTHFYWDGNDLASFTTQTVTGNATWAEGQNLASAIMNSQTSDDVAAQLIAQTINTGDAWTVAIKASPPESDVSNSNTGGRAAGIIFSDGTATTSNCVAGHIQVSNDHTVGPSLVLVGRHGTLTAISTAPWVSQEQARLGEWLYIKLTYQAANTFRLAFSPDGVSYSTFGEADISKTMTPSFVGIFGWGNGAGDSILTFGPLKKV